eukprot:NODE_1852_length_714_cov_29.432709_g1802_i0.p1 GENE.NODE_1852_length_714_cov_29.432709_g1802_i0~~NODE_1852_length_714_cov_29.432709_g1802_i0.p1  ORF type:complete len:190 (+),score=49.81 NODE_1852_length_714_cov_29.432709_g1802_i0:73-642(+)
MFARNSDIAPEGVNPYVHKIGNGLFHKDEIPFNLRFNDQRRDKEVMDNFRNQMRVAPPPAPVFTQTVPTVSYGVQPISTMPTPFGPQQVPGGFGAGTVVQPGFGQQGFGAQPGTQPGFGQPQMSAKQQKKLEKQQAKAAKKAAKEAQKNGYDPALTGLGQPGAGFGQPGFGQPGFGGAPGLGQPGYGGF